MTGPDGGINTFFPNPSFLRFGGTSAAAPHVVSLASFCMLAVPKSSDKGLCVSQSCIYQAAVAALMLEADPMLGRNEIKDILKKTAIGMSDPMIPFSEEQRFDFRTGNGFVNASAAFEELLSRQRKEAKSRNLRAGSTTVLA